MESLLANNFLSQSFSPNSPSSLNAISEVIKHHPPDDDAEGFIPVSNRRLRNHPLSKQGNLRSSCLSRSPDVVINNHDSLNVHDGANLYNFFNQNHLSSSEGSVNRKLTGKKVIYSTNPKSWKDVVCGSSSVEFKLSYYPPEQIQNSLCAKIPKEIITESRNKWSNSVVIYVLGPKPYYQYFKEYIIIVWQPAEKFQIYSRDNGFYIIKFESKSDCDRVIKGGPYYYNNRLLMLKRRSPGLKFTKDIFNSVPIWIKLPNLDLDLWSPEAISRIVSIIGRPIKLDQITEGMIRLSYVRVLVEVDINSKFPSKLVAVDSDNNIYYQDVIYEWIPYKCSTCNYYGHIEKYCSFTEEWLPKMKPDDKEIQGMDIEKNSLDDNIRTDFDKQKIVDKESMQCMEIENKPLYSNHDGYELQDKVDKADRLPEMNIIDNSQIVATSNSDNQIDKTEGVPGVQMSEECSLANSEKTVLNRNELLLAHHVSNQMDHADANCTSRLTRNKMNKLFSTKEKVSLDEFVIDNPKCSQLVSQLNSRSRRKRKSRISKKDTSMLNDSVDSLNNSLPNID